MDSTLGSKIKTKVLQESSINPRSVKIIHTIVLLSLDYFDEQSAAGSSAFALAYFSIYETHI